MKSRWFSFAVLATALVLSIGCQSSGGDDGVTAPDMGSPVDIPIEGATAQPADQAAAEALYADGSAALAAVLASNVSLSNARSVRGRITAARATDSGGAPISETVTLPEGGTVVLTGDYEWNEKYPDDGTQPQPNRTYNDYVSFSAEGNVTGVITAAKAAYNGHTYTISGRIVNTEAIYMNVDLVTSSTSYSMDLDFGIQLTIGYAISVVREDGVGAKFILAYAADYARNNISINEDTDMNAAFGDELLEYFANQPVILAIYSADNQLLYSSTMTAEEAFESSVFENID